MPPVWLKVAAFRVPPVWLKRPPVIQVDGGRAEAAALEVVGAAAAADCRQGEGIADVLVPPLWVKVPVPEIPI